MNQPLVSIVFPVYNVEKYVFRALSSVINQIYENIELIIVDDCGNDNSIQIVKDFVSSYKGDKVIALYHQSHNMGLSAARNRGMKEMHGDFVYFFDSDDELPNDSIKNLVSVLNKYPNSDLVVGRMASLTENAQLLDAGSDFSKFPEFSDNKEWIHRNIFDYSKGYFIPSVSTNKLYSVRFIHDNQLSFFEGIIHEDEKMVFDVANAIHSIAFCDKVTYNRYVNSNSIMTSLNMDKSASAWTIIIRTSYLKFSQPYVDLKLLYSLGELKRCFFCLSKDARNTVGREMKLLLNELSRYSKDKGYEWLSILYKFLYLTPFFITNNKFMQKVYKRLYNFKRLVVKCKF